MKSPFDHLLVTGGCGFIGSNFIRHVLNRLPEIRVTNLDSLSYSGNLENLADVSDRHGISGDGRYSFVHASINDAHRVASILRQSAEESGMPTIDAVVHFAAESHVDRSILGPEPFVTTNVLGTTVLLEACRTALNILPDHFRFLHISTDEVYGSLDSKHPPFTESAPLSPNSPYAASKAASDLLVASYVHTFEFPAIITRSSNNYGPFQYPEKLLPLMITRALRDAPLPVYGDGLNIRDWIYVDDHCDAIMAVLEGGRIGCTYNIGGGSEISNLDLIRQVLGVLAKPEDLIKFVPDRPGHDRRYAIDSTKIQNDLGWKPEESFSSWPWTCSGRGRAR